MKIGHFSDLHGDFSALAKCQEIPDLWISTGDIFPNLSSHLRWVEEVEYQVRWFHEIFLQQLEPFLHGRPLLSVSGNHDFVNLANLMQFYKYPVFDVDTDGMTIEGIRFSGFPEIPYINGEWNFEAYGRELASKVAEVFTNPPDVLLTHCPTAGILDTDSRGEHLGIHELLSAFAYKSHKIKAHLFGHIHECGGQMAELMGIKFYNGACGLRMIEL